MSQVLSATLEANTRYELSVQVGNPYLFNGSTVTANYRVELLAGGVLLASDTGPSPADDTTWKTATVVYDSGEEPAQLGEPARVLTSTTSSLPLRVLLPSLMSSS